MAIKQSILLYLIFVVNIKATAQDYNIKSFDNKINVLHVQMDYVNNLLKVIYSSDTFCVNDVTDFVVKPDILGENFLRILYKKRVGSGSKTHRLLLMSINNNHLVESLHIIALSESTLNDVYDNEIDSLKLFNEHQYYESKIIISGDNCCNYKIIASIKHKNTSKQDEIDNFNYEKEIVLKFDKEKCIFYSDYKLLRNISLLIYNPLSHKDSEKIINEKIPIVTLGRMKYYFIENKWHEVNLNNYLIQYAY